jgi:hypothetical protein
VVCGLIPVLALAGNAGLRDLADKHLTIPTDKGANAELKVASPVGEMVAGADSIDGMAQLRHGGMSRVFARCYSTLGSFVRAFTFGHVRQLDAMASRFPIALAGLTGLIGRLRGPALIEEDARYALVDVCRRHLRRGPRSRQAGCWGWLQSHGDLDAIGAESTGSSGVTLTRALVNAGERVIKVNRANRIAKRWMASPTDSIPNSSPVRSSTTPPPQLRRPSPGSSRSSEPRTSAIKADRVSTPLSAFRSILCMRLSELGNLSVRCTPTPERTQADAGIGRRINGG